MKRSFDVKITAHPTKKDRYVACYASEFLAGAFPGAGARRYARSAAHTQDALGRLNDLAQARELLGLLAFRLRGEAGTADSAAGFVLGWSAHEADETLDAGEKAWARFRRARPFWR